MVLWVHGSHRRHAPQVRLPLSILIQSLPFRILIGCVAAMWAVHVVNFLLGYSLNSFGIKPRTMMGLVGVATSPFLHGSFLHIIGNTIPFIVMGGLLAAFYKNDFVDVIIGVTLLAGFSTWLLGAANTNHVGASGVVFGLAGFLMGAGFFTKQFIPMGIAVVIVLFYGANLMTGLIPVKSGVSYLGHWMGLFSGVAMSYLFKMTR